MPASPAPPDAPDRLVIEPLMRMQLIGRSSTMNGMIGYGSRVHAT
jgi:hypothetical protein